MKIGNLGLMKGITVACLVGGMVLAGVKAHAEILYGTTVDNQVISFDSASPGTILSAHAIFGLQANERVIGLSYAAGTVYALGSFSDLYALNPTTGAATLHGSQFSTLLNGLNFGMDIRENQNLAVIVSDVGQNLSVSLTTGAVTVNPTLGYAGGDTGFGQIPKVDGLAFDKSAVRWYAVDSQRSAGVVLVPGLGQLTTLAPGNLTLDLSPINGTDISPRSGTWFLASPATKSGTQANLYTVNKTSGQATFVGLIGLSGQDIMLTGLTAVPEPATWAIAGFGIAALLVLRRRR